MSVQIAIPKDEIADFCKRHYIRKLSLFGSVLREDFRPDSDIDVLVEFEPGHTTGLLHFAELQIELSELLGREVHLSTAGFLSQRIRDKVLNTAQVQYDHPS